MILVLADAYRKTYKCICILRRDTSRDDCRNPCFRDASRDNCRNLYRRDTIRDNRRNFSRRNVSRDDCRTSLASCVY